MAPLVWLRRRGTFGLATALEAKKDAAAREAMLTKLEQALAHGAKSIDGNVGFKRFVRVQKGPVSIHRDAVARDARLDGSSYCARTPHSTR